LSALDFMVKDFREPLKIDKWLATKNHGLMAEVEIHKILSPHGLRIFLAQERIFLLRRIALDTSRSEIHFELPKIFRNAPIVNF